MTIDEEGYFVVDGLRMADAALGLKWLSLIRIDERGRAFFIGENDERVLIEAFDQPLVALDAEVKESKDAVIIWARFPYGFETEILADSFRVDEWDRFYARTREGVPLVLNRSAQGRLFQQAIEYDDDSVTFENTTLQIRPLFEENPDYDNSLWWTELYKTGGDRWERGHAHPLLETLIPPLKLTRCRVLVLGCGSGHEAAWWEKRGHIVTAVDFSEEALERGRALYGERETLRWVKADAFSLPKDNIHAASFDVIYEQLFFCAIPPSRREELVRTWYRLLSQRGRLIGFIPVFDKLLGPPYGSSEWEIRKRLLDPPSRQRGSSRRARFLPLLWNREKGSAEKWLGSELFFVVEKADTLTD